MSKETEYNTESLISASNRMLFALKGSIQMSNYEDLARIDIRPVVPDSAQLWRALAPRLAPVVLAVLEEEYQRRLPAKPLPFGEAQVRDSLELLGQSYESRDYAGCIEWLIWEDAYKRAEEAPVIEFNLSLKAAIDAANRVDPLDLFISGFQGVWTEIIRGGSTGTVLMPVPYGVGFHRVPLDSIDRWLADSLNVGPVKEAAAT
jgi:hypothetical protein